MIKFEHNSGDLKCAVFGGDVSDLCADLCLEMSLIFGALKNANEDAANEFRRNMLISMVDPEIIEKIFSTELYDEIASAKDHFTVGAMTISDKDEFARQLKELLDEDK